MAFQPLLTAPLLLGFSLPFHIQAKADSNKKIRFNSCLSRFEPMTILMPIQYITIQPTHIW